MSPDLPGLLASARQMLSVLKAAYGANEIFLQKGQARSERVQDLTTELELLQATLLLKTAELDTAICELRNWHFEAEAIIKLAHRRPFYKMNHARLSPNAHNMFAATQTHYQEEHSWS